GRGAAAVDGVPARHRRGDVRRVARRARRRMSPGGLRTAWIFLTRVPIGDDPRPDVSRAVPWFPVVGASVGAVAAAVWAGANELLAPLPSAALAITIGAMVTGAFHHDGLADMADAFGGGWGREQRLRILKDSRHGTYGVMALVCAVLLQVSALA